MFEPGVLVKGLCQMLIDRASRQDDKQTIRSLSEDTICFYLATCLMKSGYAVHQIEMEFPHTDPRLVKRESKVDIVAREPTGTLWFEAKFDKRPPTASSLVKLFKDFVRAGIIVEGRRFVLYVYATVGQRRTISGEKYAHWLDSPPRIIDVDSLQEFSTMVGLRLDPAVCELLPKTGLTASLCAKKEALPYTCFLYEISERV